jgi:arsenite-transporting ATPase
MRIIIFTGGGGSGVSTVAAATAAQLAHEGVRTLAFSLYPGLADAFQVSLTGGPQQVGENLEVMESRRLRDDADELRDWLEDLLDWRGMDAVSGDDLASLPGLNHVGRLLELEGRVASGDYEAIVLDAAPVVQFLELPPALDAAGRWLDRLFAPREQTIFEPFLRAFAGDYASTADDVMERGQALLGRLADLRDLLTDPQTCSVRLVTAAVHNSPERLREAITAFHLFSYAVDAVVMNRLLPERDGGDFFSEMAAAETSTVASIGEAASGVPVLKGGLRSSPPLGLDALLVLAAELYGGTSPGDVLHETAPRMAVHENGKFEMELLLPYAKKEELSLEQSEDGVVIHLREHRCVVTLPEDVRDWQAASWTFEAPNLKVTLRP